MTTQRLSIVVIGRNEGERLARCFESIRKIEWPVRSFELIYADSGSTDHSLEIARSFGADTIVLEAARPTAAAGRNAGWRRSSGELILFLDGDTVLHRHFAIASLPAFEDPRTAVVWGHRRELHPENSIYNRILDLDWIYPAGVSEFCGGDALIRRVALEQAGGFDASLIAGEEPELCARLRARGWRIIHCDCPMTGHDLAMRSFGQYWRRALRAGYAYQEVSARFRHSIAPFWQKEVRRNRIRAWLLIGGLLAAPVFCFALQSPWPAGFTVAGFLLLATRTAWKARWKSHNLRTLLLYGLHSHLQQIPIYVGQLQQRQDRRRGRTRSLIEYKPAP